MSVGWNGPDPVADNFPTPQEVGTEYRAEQDITIASVRVWADATELNQANRKARLWSVGGGQLGIASLPTDLPTGWSIHDLDVPVERLAGQRFVVSFSTGGNEGFANHALDSDVPSADGAVTALGFAGATNGNGVANLAPGTFPTGGSSGHHFYGADIVYTLGIGGNTAPRITSLAASVLDEQVTATAVVEDDETLVGASYRWHWGDGQTSLTTTPAAQHSYSVSGTYALLLEVSDADGLTDNAATAFTVRVPPTGTPKHPSSTQVMVAWLRAIEALPAGVATTLPAVAEWFEDGFVTVPATPGGSPNIYIPERRPVMQVDCWAANRAAAGADSVSRKVPLGKANELADIIVNATYTEPGELPTQVLMPAGYKQVRIESVFPVSEPRRVPAPETSYAHFSVDIALHYIEQTPVI